MAIKASACNDVPHNILDHGPFFCFCFRFFVCITYLIKDMGYAELAWLYVHNAGIVSGNKTYRKQYAVQK